MSLFAKNNIKLAICNLYKSGKRVWNKGLTKETDKRIEEMSKKIKNNLERSNKIKLSKLGKKRKPFNQEWRQKLSLACIKNKKWSKEKNPSWRGGVSKLYISGTHGISRYEWRYIRKEVLQIQGNICRICKKETKKPHIDHIIPYYLSFNNILTNLQVLCNSCHAKKTITEHKLVVV